jgi:hypothetical protein
MRWIHTLFCLLLSCSFCYAADVRNSDSLLFAGPAVEWTVHELESIDTIQGWSNSPSDEPAAYHLRSHSQFHSTQSRTQLSGFLPMNGASLAPGDAVSSVSTCTANIYFGSYLKCLLFPKHFFW